MWDKAAVLFENYLEYLVDKLWKENSDLITEPHKCVHLLELYFYGLCVRTWLVFRVPYLNSKKRDLYLYDHYVSVCLLRPIFLGMANRYQLKMYTK